MKNWLNSHEIHHESDYIGKTEKEIIFMLGREADEIKDNEWMYILGSYGLGIVNKKLFLYFDNNCVLYCYKGIL